MRILSGIGFMSMMLFSAPVAHSQSYADAYQRVARDDAQQQSDKYLDILTVDNPDPDDLCVQARITGRSWLEAGSQAEYSKWKKVEKTWCGKAMARKR